MSDLKVNRATAKDIVLCNVKRFLSSTPSYPSLSIQKIFDIVARGITQRIATRCQVGSIFYELIDSGKVPQLKGIRDQAVRGKRKTKRESKKRWRKMCEKGRPERNILTLNLTIENPGMPRNIM